VVNRRSFIVEVLRDRNALYRVLADGAVENDYTLKIVNKTDRPMQYLVSMAAAPADARLLDVPPRIDAPAGAVIPVPLRIIVPAPVHGRHTLVLEVEPVTDEAAAHRPAEPQRVASSFFGPSGTAASPEDSAGRP
jgi:polyferredoxin